ncbi:hypothetical protein TrST_g13196 [Triparma strigata]|uniref:Uncharacterized protein n=1 Tax=Triparma strigata TaxID=1606541 RepID=A0A9W7BT55_9STRA|nr:hypothetical protein TrST_g13196 [Triparma strigata]
MAKSTSAPPAHAWSSATTDNPSSSSLTSVTDPVANSSVNTYLTLPVEECERMIEGFREFKLEEIGSEEYLKQFNSLQTLNLTAHLHAQSHTDEYILESLSTFSSLPLLLSSLLTLETYRTLLLPPLLSSHPSLPTSNGLRLYFTLYSEASTLNLLELLFYHKHTILENLPQTLDTVDYCVRQIRGLCLPVKASKMMEYVKRKYEPGEEGERIMSRTKSEELRDQRYQIEYSLGLSSLTIVRYLLESFPSLPLNVQSRLLKTHDILLMLIPLIEEPPWIRLTSSSWEVYEEGKWTVPEDLNVVGKSTAQVWLCVFYLTGTKECRESYPLNDFRKGQILRLRKYLTDVLIDQIPVLADVRRYFDELALLQVPNHPTEHEMTEIAPMKDEINRSFKPQIVEVHYTKVWENVKDATDPQLKTLTDVYTETGIETILGEPPEFRLNGLPVKSLTLTLGTSEVHFTVKPKDYIKGVISETDRGVFKRYKLTPEAIITVTESCVATALVVFESEINHRCEVKGEVVLGEDKKKLWCQVGSVGEECVVQIGLERIEGEWKVNKGFVSLPVNDE